MNKIRAFFIASFIACGLQAQNPKIKCYFNHPVNTGISSGVNAVYLNKTFKDTLIAYINRAKYSIDLCVYNFYQTSSSDAINSIATAVNNAYTRGVTIRWIGNGTSSNNAWVNLNAGISTVSSPTTSGYGICHNKFVVFDANSANANDPIVWTGSYNFTTEQNQVDFNNVIIIQDKNVAQAYYSQFNQMWGGTAATPTSANSKFGIYKTASAVNSFTVNGTPVQVYFSPKDNAGPAMRNNLHTANSELFAAIYTWTDISFADTVKAKYNAGLDVKVIMDSYSKTYSPFTTLKPVLWHTSAPVDTTSRMRMFYGGNSAVYHNKIMLIDHNHPASDPMVCTGSFNWTSSAEALNDENSIVIHDATIANQYYQSLCQNFTDIGGVACTALVGIESFDSGDDQMAVYPNPASGHLSVKIKKAGDKFTIKLTDMLGKTVKEEVFAGTDEASVSLQDLNSGIYFIQLNRGDRVFTQKIIKE